MRELKLIVAASPTNYIYAVTIPLTQPGYPGIPTTTKTKLIPFVQFGHKTDHHSRARKSLSPLRARAPPNSEPENNAKSALVPICVGSMSRVHLYKTVGSLRTTRTGLGYSNTHLRAYLTATDDTPPGGHLHGQETTPTPQWPVDPQSRQRSPKDRQADTFK